MVYYLIVCRSLTYAQRTASALERAGITAHILRSPKMISGEGCSHSVKVSERNLAPALLILGRVGLTPKRIYIMSSDGSYKEVLLLSILTARPHPYKNRPPWRGRFRPQWGAWQPLAAAGMFPPCGRQKPPFSAVRQRRSSFRWRAQNRWCSPPTPPMG